MAHPICVTGLGCCSAAGENLHQSWINLCKNSCPPPHQPPFPTSHTAPVFSIHPNWSPPDVSPFAGQITTPLNPTTLFCLSAIRDALAMAGLSPASLPSMRVAIVVGTTVRCHFHNNDYYNNWKQGHVQDQGPMDCYLNDNLATMIQQLLATHGPTTVITNACASGTDAIGIGRNMLLADQCDIAIVGGADELSPLAYHGFASLLLCAESPCRPFDVHRGGLNLGEGAGIMILEQEEQTRKRGGRHCGWIRGYGAGSDGYHPTAPHPEARGLIRAISTALKDGGITNADISFINGHGTGTRANDLAETIGLKAVHLDQCPLVSTKGVTGHTLGGAGGIEAVLTMQALQEGYSPGTIGCREPDSELAVIPCSAEEGSTLAGPIGMSQSLAFGGGNSALIIEAKRN